MNPDIDICICSHRRPEIVETLAGVSRQSGVDPRRIRVIVADNTVSGESRRLAALAAEEFRLDLHYVHAPANNISIARNACLDAARGQWIAFLDDDELPSPVWLSALLAEAARGNWQAVLGPVSAIYPDDLPSWLSDGNFHSTRPVWLGGQIATAYTGNVLFRRHFADRFALRFRIDLGNTGGEDEDFFYRFRDAGGRIGFAPTAVCYERVPRQRANLAWLLRRNFRAGQSHGARLKKQPAAPLWLPVAFTKAVFCGAGAVVNARSAVIRSRYLTRAALHCGVVARLAGFPVIRMY